ncbi:hypothetical protein FOA43_000047 [Brettanomyces nanus]|uniref:Uncharacterized protein n=1 Tax=Eeniella nana TaxID=13502 RepID=A0A875RVU5_EENNA|nr:uncharacterized protein FOA43_000047 [Brettanomyces nanus]QPG72746.1 hypothetical protein FOA43_000047 [Brettanomyces nanus]
MTLQITSLLEDRTSISHDITCLAAATTLVPSVQYSCKDEQIDLNADDLSKSDNFTIIDISDNLSVDKTTCLSNSWQVTHVGIENWKFEDAGAETSKVDTLKLVVLHGTQSELSMEPNSEVDDVVPRNDLKYTAQLATLFTERNKQLNEMIDLN